MILSGIDEQMLFKDFPSCPACADGEYWTGTRLGKHEIYFNPEDYINGDVLFQVVIYDDDDGGRFATLEELNEVVLIKCESCLDKVNKSLFNDILTIAKRLIEEYRCQE